MVWRLELGRTDGFDENEGVGSNAGRKRRLVDKLLQIMCVVERYYLKLEAPSKAEVQTELAAAMSTKEILINKQGKK